MNVQVIEGQFTEQPREEIWENDHSESDSKQKEAIKW